MRDFFLKAYQNYCKNNQLSYSEDIATKEYNSFVRHVNRLALEYFNSPYFIRGKQNESERNN